MVFDFFFFVNLQVVGESGLFTPSDVAYVQEAGVKAVSRSLTPLILLIV